MSLWRTSKIQSDHISPQARIISKTKNKEASFYTCHKASLTVEAAVVLPLLAGFFVTILFFFRVIQVQATIEEALLYAGRKTAVEASVIEDDVALFVSANAFLQYGLKDNKVVERFVEQEALGVTLIGSYLSGDKITLRAHYVIELPIAFFGIDGIYFWNKCTFRKWHGDQPVSDTSQKTATVYVTSTGTVYHATDTCQAIKINLKMAQLQEMEDIRGLDGQKYYACTCCAEENTNAGMVYYTDYGIRYHGRLDCKYIKRSIKEIPISEAGERNPCSYCY